MSEIERVEILVIGSGESGKWLAWTMGEAGRRTAVVERRLIGGSCPNIACLPSKNVIHSAKVAEYVRRASDFGIKTGSFSIEMTGVRQRKRRMVDDEIAFHIDRYKANGVDFILGEARFMAPRRVEVRTNDGTARVLEGEQVFLNLGTTAAAPDVPGLKEASPLTHVEALELDHIPEHLIVYGGGYVGLELGQAMRRFGSRVTIVERGPQLASREDPDVANEILTFFRREGIDVLLNSEIVAVQGKSGQKVAARIKDPSGEHQLDGTDILVATGRSPNTSGIDLDKTGVELDSRGYIKVNERLQTTATGVWAMGECAGSPQFTHVAFDDFRVVRDNLSNRDRSTRGRLVPFCMFTDPELARVGLNESEARKLGIEYRIARIPMVSVLRTHTLSETEGFMKALISVESDEILGFMAIGVQAGEFMAVVQTAMLGRLPYTILRDAIFAHPTLAEGLTVLFAAVPATTRTAAEA